MRLILPYSIGVIVFGLVSWHLVVSSVFKDAIRIVCETVSDRIYTDQINLNPWKRECLSLTSNVSAFRHKSHVVEMLDDQLGKLGYSHLGIYVPSETKALWTGKAQDTGLRGRFVEDQFVIYEVIENSPASEAEVIVGDSLATINSKSITSVSQAQLVAGEYVFIRGEDSYTVKIQPREIQVDQKPLMSKLDDSTGLLKVTGFRKELFESEDWKQTIEENSSLSSMIVDLRGNPGGSFVAMLRALSVFQCKAQSVGFIVKPRQAIDHSMGVEALPDDSRDDVQVTFFTQYPMVNLQTYTDYPCFAGEVVVLIDEETASVAEIFAEAMRESGRAKVLGRASSGDVLLGVWYDFSMMGRGYSFSVPEALYQNLAGETLEGIGVTPDLEFDYELKDALEGKDTFVLKARKILGQKR